MACTIHVPDYPEMQFITSQVGVNALTNSSTRRVSRRPIPSARVSRAVARDISSGAIDVKAILRRVPLFNSFGDDDIAALADEIRLQDFKPGTEIVSEGAAGESLFVVVSGLLDVFKQTDAAEARKVGLLTPGHVFGEWSLLTGASRSATVTAAAETSLLEIDKAKLVPILTPHPEILAELSRIEVARSAANVSAMAFTPAEREEIAELGMAQFLRQKIMRFFSAGRNA